MHMACPEAHMQYLAAGLAQCILSGALLPDFICCNAHRLRSQVTELMSMARLSACPLAINCQCHRTTRLIRQASVQRMYKHCLLLSVQSTSSPTQSILGGQLSPFIAPDSGLLKGSAAVNLEMQSTRFCFTANLQHLTCGV